MRWIVVDGIDGSGKSTVAAWISSHYESSGERVHVRVHPSAALSGRIARKGLLGRGPVMRTVATLFFILDVLISVSWLRRNSRSWDTVIFVRYLMATAYLPENLMRTGYGFFAKLLPVPRRLLLVDVEASSALERIRARGGSEEMFEDLTSLEKARRKVRALAGPEWAVLENEGDPEAVRGRALAILSDWDASR
ncbi:MAG TPA: thymidylate kinase [Methanomassiliicoccales archaeon]|nr:thymidylate kinase [Methanomassiliicoccales archaeon]